MSDEWQDVDSPGVKLKRLLEKIYKFDNRKSYVTDIDDALMLEGELSAVTYSSLINYLVRRLICATEYIRRDYVDNDLGFIVNLRSYIRDYTRIPRKEVEVVVDLLKQCSDVVKRDISGGVFHDVERMTKSESLSCYICGRKIDFEDRSSLEYFQAEHSWPQQMGGAANTINVRGSCRKCNQYKKNYMDSSDFHYEHICMKTDETDNGFAAEFRYEHKIAVWSRFGYRCMNCKQPASRVGNLRFIRLDPDQNWHYLNIGIYCQGCIKLFVD